MKRTTILLGAPAVALALCLAFTACGGESPRPAASGDTTASKAPAPAAKKGGRRGAGKTPSTAALGLRVKLELLQKLGADGLRVEVEATGGSVVLAGTVKKRATSELASEVARQVEGVTAVENRIQVADAGPGGVDQALAEAEKELDDAALETRVRIALVDRLGSDGFRIGTDAASGVLTLEFPKGVEKGRRREAIRIAKRVPGVQKVVPLDKK